ncbi:MAG: peptidoglycan DD-metalloendopeptidase family protein [Phaeodactylibacter sp.]|nr:peptidoglycan DD-metalloendopeptidase family protein [Phaeodactylibacter sp.]
MAHPLTLFLLLSDPYPILGPSYTTPDFFKLNLSVAHLRQAGISFPDMDALETYVQQTIRANKTQFAVGGYLEHRNLYQTENFIKSDQPTRDRHLGIDFWGPVGTPIYAPLDGIIHSFTYNALPLDYGYTLILQHQLDGFIFHSLYGHLAKPTSAAPEPGTPVSKGELIAHFGPLPENGGWAPHLHFQLVIDLQGQVGDYPGVCAVDDLDYYQHNCPDPYSLFLSFLESVA